MAKRVDHKKLRSAILKRLERGNFSTTELHVSLQGILNPPTRNAVKNELLALEDERIIKRVGRNFGLKWQLRARAQ